MEGVAGYKNGHITRLINGRNGLTSDICLSMFLAGNVLWVGTDKGLNKVTLTADSFSITHFTKADGLSSQTINAVEVDGDSVYVGTPEGVTYFTENRVFTNSMCRLKIISVRSDKQQLVSGFDQLLFDHYDNNLRFEYAGISFKSAGDISYRYRVLGLEDNWHTTTDNFLAFPALPSGEYELQIQATNKFGIKSDPVSLKFEVAKLLWEEPWFRVTGMVLLAIAIWFFVRWRIGGIQRLEAAKTATNRRIAELEQMGLKAQMNPHFIFNTLNSIQQYIFDKDVQGANKFIIEFSRLIRLTLDLSSKSKISIGEEVRYLSTYLKLEQRRFEDKFGFHILVSDESLNHMDIPPMILQPYIENSIRHGVRYRDDNAGIITVKFIQEAKYLVCTVEDNGVGRETSKQLKGTQNIEYQSKGMTLTARRIEMMNSTGQAPIEVEVEDLYDSNQHAAGTRVIIRFPV